jgi:hypothetical protein
MKKIVLLWACILASVISQAQELAHVDSLNDINAIKRDTSFIYAESTMRDALEAQSGAKAILELKLYDWLRSSHPDENAEVLVTNSKDKWFSLLTKRGRYNRVFVYVSKRDVLPSLKPKEFVEDSFSQQEKIAFIKRMYKDFFENSSFDTENLSQLRKYLSSDVAKQIRMQCPYDGCDETDSSYVVYLFVDGSLSYERPDPGNRVVTRSIKPLKYDWFVVTNIWDVVEDPITVGLKIQNTKNGLSVVDFSIDGDRKTDGLSTTENTIEDWELLISPEEQKMISLVSFYEIEPYIKQLKANDRINGYGKYSTLPKDDLCHVFIYNKEGEIVTVLLKTPQNTYNLRTREKDVISNYKGCGAIWFTLR